MKKYRLTNETIEVDGRTLHRIEAIRDFGNAKAGDKGGFIEEESNLSHHGNCWVDDDACVYGYAEVYDDAYVFENAQVYDYAEVYGSARVSDYARIYGDAEIYGNSEVFGFAHVYDDAHIFGIARAYGEVHVFGNAHVFGCADLTGDAKVQTRRDYIVFNNWWSSGRYFTWTRSNNMWRVGCFYGTSDELIEKAYHDSKFSGREFERVIRYVESILADENKPSENNQ